MDTLYGSMWSHGAMSWGQVGCCVSGRRHVCGVVESYVVYLSMYAKECSGSYTMEYGMLIFPNPTVHQIWLDQIGFPICNLV